VSDSSGNGALLENTGETRTDMAAEVKGQLTGIALMRWEPSNWKSTLEIRGGIIERGLRGGGGSLSLWVLM